MTPDEKRALLISFLDALAYSQQHSNDAAEDDDRGRNNLAFALMICDDGSASVGEAIPMPDTRPDSPQNFHIEFSHDFKDLEALADHLIQDHDILEES